MEFALALIEQILFSLLLGHHGLEGIVIHLTSKDQHFMDGWVASGDVIVLIPVYAQWENNMASGKKKNSVAFVTLT